MKKDSAATAWGSVHAFLGAQGANGAMGTNLEDLGAIDTDALTLETADGTVYQLKDINGKLVDELQLEPEITVKFTLLKPSDAVKAKFWDIEQSGEGNDVKIRVKSHVMNARYSFKFANLKAIGSETFEAPSVKVSMKPGFSAQKGFTAECSAKIMEGGAGFLYQFGTVVAPEVVPEG